MKKTVYICLSILIAITCNCNSGSENTNSAGTSKKVDTTKVNTINIQTRIHTYLERTANTYSVGQHEYYARIALECASNALKNGNYGVGAIAVYVKGDSVSEFWEGNAMVTDLGVIDHAETRALLKLKNYLNNKIGAPDKQYAKTLNEYTRALPEGISVFATLEPCPMCAIAMTNVAVVQSVSTVMDGNLITKNGCPATDGGAIAIGDKAKLQPAIWKSIQDQEKLRFSLLETKDSELRELSEKVFTETRGKIDSMIAARGKK